LLRAIRLVAKNHNTYSSYH